MKRIITIALSIVLVFSCLPIATLCVSAEQTELLTGGECLQGFRTPSKGDSTKAAIRTDTDQYNRRAYYSKLMDVTEGQEYTLSFKGRAGDGIKVLQLKSDGTSIVSNTNYWVGRDATSTSTQFYFKDNKFTATITPASGVTQIGFSMFNQYDSDGSYKSNPLGVTCDYERILNDVSNGTVAVSFIGNVVMSELEVDLNMKKGAAIRLNNEAGLRFYTTVDADKLDKLVADGATVEMGTLIAPADLLGTDELTLETDASKRIVVPYDYEQGYFEDDNTFIGSIIDIKQSDTSYNAESGNIARNYIGRGYVTVTKGDDSYTSYAKYYQSVVSNNTRSVKRVSILLKNDDIKYKIIPEYCKANVEKWSNAVQNEFTVTNEMTGGNIKVISINENSSTVEVALKNETRDSAGEWFYWAFRVDGAAGKKIKFIFRQSNKVGYYGAAASTDLENWKWVNSTQGSASDTSLTYSFGEDENTVYFAHHMLYHPDRFNDLADELGLTVNTLCKSEKGRDVPYVQYGNGDKYIILTARHHACESTGNYVLEGVLRQLVKNNALLKEYTVFCVPFVDYDGVVDGDQGKDRLPHDHNRDYDLSDSTLSTYNSIAAIKQFATTHNSEFAFDFHGPYHEGGSNDHQFFYKKAPDETRIANSNTFLSLFKTYSDSIGALGYNRAYDSDSDKSNYNLSTTPNCGNYMYKFVPTIDIAGTLETPYFGIGDNIFTNEKAVNSGIAFAQALETYIARDKK